MLEILAFVPYVINLNLNNFDDKKLTFFNNTKIKVHHIRLHRKNNKIFIIPVNFSGLLAI